MMKMISFRPVSKTMTQQSTHIIVFFEKSHTSTGSNVSGSGHTAAASTAFQQQQQNNAVASPSNAQMRAMVCLPLFRSMPGRSW
eukprot:8748748-Ditylum_brightwellii.AAC.1